MNRILALFLAAAMLFLCVTAGAEENADMQISPLTTNQPGGTPPEMPDGMIPGDPPNGMGTPPDMPGGERPGDPPDGMPGMPPEGMPGEPGGFGGPGGSGIPGGPGNQAPTEYAAVETVLEDAAFTGVYASTGTDENIFHVQSGTVNITDADLSRTSGDSTGGDASSFYGVGAAVLTTGGTVVMEGGDIATDAAGGTGVFAYGDGVAYVSGTTIATKQNTSGGIHVAGGGTLYARDLTVTTEGESAAAIRSDRGSGTMVVDGGSYTSHGVGSPAVYVTADITIRDADLAATGSEALCMEGLNTVRLYGCDLSGAMQDLSQNDNTWTVIVYQSMSGDAQIGKGHFEMVGGTLDSQNGGLFYTTNTESEFILDSVVITAAEDSEYFLRCTGNANQRGWGRSGANGAECTFTAIRQQMPGDVQWDSISTLDLYLTEGSVLIGAVINDESCAGEGGNGFANLTIDAASAWIVTGDSRLTALNCAGRIADAEGRSVTILSADGSVLTQGDSAYTVTVDAYSEACDLSGCGSASDWADHAVEFPQ